VRRPEVKLGHVALDGTKIKANASKHKAMSYERMGIEGYVAVARAKHAADAQPCAALAARRAIR
jgi:hypothetical protein